MDMGGLDRSSITTIQVQLDKLIHKKYHGTRREG